MKHATYWKIAPGQIGAEEHVHTGYPTARAAWKALAGQDGRVVCLRTVEYDLPADNPARQSFESARYCVVVKKAGR